MFRSRPTSRASTAPIPPSRARRWLGGFVAAVAILGACGPESMDREGGGGDGAAVQSEVRLVVMVAVDQLRGDLLDRYREVFTGGFARLREEGVAFSNATHDHARTETAAGHATLSTGVYPRRHGIVGNNWVEEDGMGGMVAVYSVEDLGSPLVGYPGQEGRSPRNFQVDGFSTWLQSSYPDARVVSISRKDRAAIGLAGRADGHVYWIVESEGQFTTSDFYRDELPEWVQGYNAGRMRELYADSVWENATPSDAWALSRGDTASFEGDGVHTWFDHRAHLETDVDRPSRYNTWIARTPVGDRAVAELAMEAVRELELGTGTGPDLLALSFSAPDYVGHRYGPLSREQLDNLVHLDRVLGELMAYLDEVLGPDAWVLGLSADHGVITIPEAQEGLVRLAPAAAEVEGLVANTVASLQGASAEEVLLAVQAALESHPTIARATSYSVLRGTEAEDSLVQLQRNGFFEGRHKSRLGVLFQLETMGPEGVLVDSSRRGTSHGSPYHYDRWVPMLFMGRGVTPGVRDDRAATVDFAPTLAGLAGIAAPVGLDGRNLLGSR